jgi:rhodanese-related sulfurtransferase
VHIPRTALAWRLDPTSAWRKQHVGTLEDPIVVVCDHGYSSSLAAYTLVQPSVALAATGALSDQHASNLIRSIK